MAENDDGLSAGWLMELGCSDWQSVRHAGQHVDQCRTHNARHQVPLSAAEFRRPLPRSVRSQRLVAMAAAAV